MKDSKQQTAEYWARNVAGTNPFSREVYWLAVPEVQKRFQRKACADKPYPSWVEYCLQEFIVDLPAQRMLSIGCGSGALERHLHRLNAFLACEGIDISSGAIAVAIEEARKNGLDNIEYLAGDIEELRLSGSEYDAVWFNGSLHHIKELDQVCDWVRNALKPSGWLFLNEYVGANRFGFSVEQKGAIEHAFYLLPRRYRRSFVNGGISGYQETPPLPDPVEVARTDPSEAVRSEDILAAIKRYFEIITVNNCGGSLLQFLLSGIAGNFQESDDGSMRLLRMLFDIEDALIEAGVLQSDFVVIAAKPKNQI